MNGRPHGEASRRSVKVKGRPHGETSRGSVNGRCQGEAPQGKCQEGALGRASRGGINTDDDSAMVLHNGPIALGKSLPTSKPRLSLAEGSVPEGIHPL